MLRRHSSNRLRNGRTWLGEKQPQEEISGIEDQRAATSFRLMAKWRCARWRGGAKHGIALPASGSPRVALHRAATAHASINMARAWHIWHHGHSGVTASKKRLHAGVFSAAFCHAALPPSSAANKAGGIE